MSEFYQFRILSSWDAATQRQAEAFGLSRERWVMKDDEWIENFLELDSEDLDNHIAMNAATGENARVTMTRRIEFNGDVILEARQVPTLWRQGNGDVGFVVPDDIARQMAHEARMIAECEMREDHGYALLWFSNSVNNFRDRSRLKNIEITTENGKRVWQAEDSEHAADQHYEAHPDERIRNMREVN